jgi:hypothetical protein
MLPKELLKLGRARKQLQDLEVVIKQWLAEGHYTVVTKADKERPYYVVLATAETIPLDPFSILIGEFIQSLRSGLDHLVFGLAAKFTVPLPGDIAKDSEFPIFGDIDSKGRSGAGAGMFRNNGLRKIRGLDPRAQAIIEALQPYHRGNAFTTDPLWKMHELSRVDKHRDFHLIAYHFEGAFLNIPKCRNAKLGPGIIDIKDGPIEQDTIIARYPATPVFPSLKMHVDFQPAVDIAFPQGSAVAGEKVIDALTSMYNHIVQNVVRPLEPFL